LPNPNISEDCITQISVYYKIYKSTSDSDVGSYLITWLPTSTIEESRVDLTSTESQKGSTESKSNVKPEMIEYKLIIVDAEKEMIEYYFNLMRNVCPDCRIGHNTFNFDNPYLYKRCKLLDIDPWIQEP